MSNLSHDLVARFIIPALYHEGRSVAELVVRSAGIRQFLCSNPIRIFIKTKFTYNFYLNIVIF